MAGVIKFDAMGFDRTMININEKLTLISDEMSLIRDETMEFYVNWEGDDATAWKNLFDEEMEELNEELFKYTRIFQAVENMARDLIVVKLNVAELLAVYSMF